MPGGHSVDDELPDVRQPPRSGSPSTATPAVDGVSARHRRSLLTPGQNEPRGTQEPLPVLDLRDSEGHFPRDPTADLPLKPMIPPDDPRVPTRYTPPPSGAPHEDAPTEPGAPGRAQAPDGLDVPPAKELEAQGHTPTPAALNRGFSPQVEESAHDEDTAKSARTLAAEAGIDVSGATVEPAPPPAPRASTPSAAATAEVPTGPDVWTILLGAIVILGVIGIAAFAYLLLSGDAAAPVDEPATPATQGAPAVVTPTAAVPAPTDAGEAQPAEPTDDAAPIAPADADPAADESPVDAAGTADEPPAPSTATTPSSPAPAAAAPEPAPRPTEAAPAPAAAAPEPVAAPEPAPSAASEPAGAAPDPAEPAPTTTEPSAPTAAEPAATEPAPAEPEPAEPEPDPNPWGTLPE